MTPARWQRISALLDAVLSLAPAARSAYLDTHCDGDVELRRELQSLLTAHEQADVFLEEPAPAFAASLLPEDTSPSNLVGQEIRGYRVLSLLGTGGVGYVYLAEHVRLGRPTALKFLHPYLRHDERAVLRFIAEAQAASALDHPNLCRIYTIDETRDGHLFIAMAYYEGETLKQKIERGPLPVNEVLTYAMQIALGLQTAHAHDIIHRDVKPANMIVTPAGVLKILDFGLAKMADVHLTQTGRILGTPAYMSPEHIRGEAVGTQTDVWSLGVVLYEMLTGQQPFRGARDHEMIHAILQSTPAPLTAHRPGVPVDLTYVVDRCLQKEAGRRYPNGEAAFAALQACSRQPGDPV